MKQLQLLFILITLLSSSYIVSAQPGPIKMERYNDDFSYLKSDSVKKKWFEKLKYMPLSSSKNYHISVGGEIREFYSFTKNSNFGDLPPSFKVDNNGALEHRTMLHADVWLGKHVRVFNQYNFTTLIGSPNEPIEEIQQDGLDLHQLFAEVHFMKRKEKKVFARLGRQEFSFGNELLISSREGPNTRQTFDAGSFTYQTASKSVKVFAGTPVIALPKSFDNRHINEYIWGVYTNFSTKWTNLDAYYIGYHSDRKMYNFVGGEQQRHTVGTRIFEKFKPFSYDIEAMYQFGKFNNEHIKAYNLTGEAKYTFMSQKLKPFIGVAGSYISGDRSATDNESNTFDPLYPKPTFGLAAPLGPSNITNIRPMAGISPAKGLTLTGSVYFLKRESNQDGTYAPSMVQVRAFPEQDVTTAKGIGTQYAFDIFYFPNPHWSFVSFLSYITPDDYVKNTGVGKELFFASAIVGYKF